MYPNVRLLAELVEGAGLNFQVIVLTRRPLEILLSTTVNRNFAPFLHQVSFIHILFITRKKLLAKWCRIPPAPWKPPRREP